jgi:hypothetical protein
MSFKSILPILTVFILFTHCGPNEQTAENSEPANIQIDTLYQFMDYDSHGITRPGDLNLLSTGNLAVIGGQTLKILVVSPDGELVTRFGQEGKGPAEFVQPSQIIEANNRINIVDRNQYKVIEFDYEGNFIDSYLFKTNAMNRNIALSDNRVYYTGASGQNNSLVKRESPEQDSALFFGEAKGELVENMDMEESRNDFKNGKIPPFFKNNTLVVLGENHVYAFLESYSELNKYDLDGSLIWSRKIELPDNQALLDQITEAVTKSPNYLPFLRYTVDINVIDEKIYLLGSNPFETPQHLTVVNSDGNIEAMYKMPSTDYYFSKFSINPDDRTIYLSDVRNGIVYKGTLK